MIKRVFSQLIEYFDIDSVLNSYFDQRADDEADWLEFVRISEYATAPEKGSELAAGYDLFAAEEVVIAPHSRLAIGTGISVRVPVGTYGRVASRSGLSVNHCVDVGAGVVDADYTGELKVCLINSSDLPFEVCIGSKIAQLVCEKISYPKIREVSNLPTTDRGDNGFGSTGLLKL